MEYYSAIKKNEILSFAISWTDLEIIILSEVSQTKTNIWYNLYVESNTMIQKKLFIKPNQTHRFWNQTYAYQRGNHGGER